MVVKRSVHISNDLPMYLLQPFIRTYHLVHHILNVFLIGGHSITTWTRLGGGGQKMSVFVHAQGIKTVHAERGGGGVKKWQNSVHVVVECPLNSFYSSTLTTHIVRNSI